jgi:diacylglycerol O-acyltransferase
MAGKEFADLIARLTTAPLDRHKPLWEAWSIEGLDGDRWALALKLSPAVSDGIAGVASVWPRLVTIDPQDDPTNVLRAEPSLGKAPSISELVADTMQELLENQFTGVWLIAGAVPGVLRVAGRRLRGTAEPGLPQEASSMSGPVPRTVFNAPLTERRAAAFASIPLAQLKTVNNAFGGSITNVFQAACTLSLRTWLQRHHTVPDDPLVMQVSLSLPDPDSRTVDDPFIVGRIRVPVQLDVGLGSGRRETTHRNDRRHYRRRPGRLSSRSAKWYQDRHRYRRTRRRPGVHPPVSVPISASWVNRTLLPDGSRKPQSMPYGISCGSSVNSTPRDLISS